MSYDATRWAWRQHVGRSSAKLVLLSLADRADEHHESYPSIARLCLDTELDRKTVLVNIAYLVDAGVITAHKTPGCVTHYRLSGVDDSPSSPSSPVPKMVPVPKTVPVPESVLDQSQKRYGTSTKIGTRTYQEPIKNLRKKNISSNDVANPVTSEGVCPIPDDPLVASTTQALALVPPVAKVATDWPGFEEFWAVYPRKEAKKATRVLWNKLRLPPETIAAILVDVPLRKSQHSVWQDEKFIPHPSSYLNGERWQDSITPKINGSHHVPRSLSKIDVYTHLDSLSSSELFGYSDRPEERRITGEVL